MTLEQIQQHLEILSQPLRVWFEREILYQPAERSVLLAAERMAREALVNYDHSNRTDLRHQVTPVCSTYDLDPGRPGWRVAMKLSWEISPELEDGNPWKL